MAGTVTFTWLTAMTPILISYSEWKTFHAPCLQLEVRILNHSEEISKWVVHRRDLDPLASAPARTDRRFIRLEHEAGPRLSIALPSGQWCREHAPTLFWITSQTKLGVQLSMD